MNRQKSIAVFAVIAAVAMTSIGLTASSNTSFVMISPTSQSPELVGMLGHVEYTVRDSENYVKSYMQGDNVVVDDGKDCVARQVFGAANAAGTNCLNTSAFNFVAIGNKTGGIGAATNLDSLHLNTTSTLPLDGNGESCATSTDDGEMARKSAVVTITTAANDAGTQGTVVELDTSANPFNFDVFNATTVHQSGIFNADITTTDTTEPGGGSCVVSGVAQTDWDMFAIQDLNSGSGIQVTDGDSLSVKWTITIG